MVARGRQTLLIFRLGSIGDTVVALPCFHAIARAFPLHHRVLLTNALTAVRASSAETVLDGTGLVDEVVYYPVGRSGLRTAVELRRELRRLRPAAVVNLAERRRLREVLRDALFFKVAGIPRILGGAWSRDLRECRIDADSQLEYEAERLARMLGRVLPVSLQPADWDLRLSAAELARARVALNDGQDRCCHVAIAPGAKIAAKDWGPENWAELLTALSAERRETVLVLVGAPDERSLCDQLARHWRGPVRNVCGELTPRETAAVLRLCRLLVCHDSGPMHLAASQATPCVALFGNYNRPRQWYPHGARHRVIYEPRGVREIGVARVMDEVRELLTACG